MPRRSRCLDEAPALSHSLNGAVFAPCHTAFGWHGYCMVCEWETIMIRQCPSDAKLTLALVALTAAGILSWLAAGGF